MTSYCDCDLFVLSRPGYFGGDLGYTPDIDKSVCKKFKRTRSIVSICQCDTYGAV